MKNKPLVSIITVVYNGKKYLEETIKNIKKMVNGLIKYQKGRKQ